MWTNDFRGMYQIFGGLMSKILGFLRIGCIYIKKFDALVCSVRESIALCQINLNLQFGVLGGGEEG